MPAGSPSLMPHGTLMDGWPVTSMGAVFGSISNARWMISMRGAPGLGIGVAFRGSVGISSRS